VLLRVAGGSRVIDGGQGARLGDAGASSNNRFQSYGFRRLGEYESGYANGVIQGGVPPRADAPPRRSDAVQLHSTQVNRGMSGAPVLDLKRNLVVGIISEMYSPIKGVVTDAGTSWAVNAKVLDQPPFRLALERADYPLGRPARIRADVDEARRQTPVARGLPWQTPAWPADWVGREGLRLEMNAAWKSRGCRVLGLIGFGGEGKSTLALRWLQLLKDDKSLPAPDGVFWWDFNRRPNVLEFFEVALGYVSGGQFKAQEAPSASERAHHLAAMLGAGRFVFVLDGLEGLQRQELRDQSGGRIGQIRDHDLKEFLDLFASPEHESFCLITSRVPVHDLMKYTTYVERAVDHLTEEEGASLLKLTGVRGTPKELREVVKRWDGHALTLRLLGTYLAKQYDGELAHEADVEPPKPDEPRYERIHRILGQYANYLGDEGKRFLEIFSAFRVPVLESAFPDVFVGSTGSGAPATGSLGLNAADLEPLKEKLIDVRVLRFDAKQRHYTVHPLIHSHYQRQLRDREPADRRALHLRVAAHYLKRLGTPSARPTIEELIPGIEAVHHACRAEDYAEAWRIAWDLLSQQRRYVMTVELCAYETTLTSLLEFFPGDNASADLPLPEPAKSAILHGVGHSLRCLGRLTEAKAVYARALEAHVEAKSWDIASVICTQLVELEVFTGEIRQGFNFANDGVTYADQVADVVNRVSARAHRGSIHLLLGEMDQARREFGAIMSKLDESIPAEHYNATLPLLLVADYLRRTKESEKARAMVERILAITRRRRFPDDESRAYRLRGDLRCDEGQQDSAGPEYAEALRLAQSIAKRDVLIEALLARGTWLVGRKDLEGGRADLEDALSYSVAGAHVLYEAEARIGLARCSLRGGYVEDARREAGLAATLSDQTGYVRGGDDARALLRDLPPG
jgi:tetratricopeptide (TPR) repeat protein